MNQVRAAFDVMTSENTIQLDHLLSLGKDVLKYADNASLSLNEGMYHILDTSVRQLEAQMAQGAYVIDFVDNSANRTFDLAGSVAGANDDRLEQALDLVAEVKTEGYAQTLETVSTLMVIFGLGALWLTTRND